MTNNYRSKYGAGPRFSKYEKLSGRQGGVPYTPQDTGIFGVYDESYPNYYCGRTDGTIVPTNFDRNLFVWGYAEPYASNFIGPMPYIYAQITCMYYVEFYDPYPLPV